MKKLQYYNIFLLTESYTDVGNKMRRVIWRINKYHPVYSSILSHVNIYGTNDPRYTTMATNGVDIIFSPKFVEEQTEKALAFVLIHEVLHCLLRHNERLGDKTHEVWNYATDYAINPIIVNDTLYVDGKLEWPKMDGERMGLYEPDYVGLTADAIYKILIDDYTPKPKEKPFDTIIGKITPQIIEDLIIQISNDSVKNEPNDDEPNGDEPIFTDKTTIVEAPGDIPGEKRVTRDVTKGEIIGSKVDIIKNGITRTIDWEDITRSAIRRHGDNMSDISKKILGQTIGADKKPIVNWEQELKKFFDIALKKANYRPYDKRTIAAGRYDWTSKRSGINTLKIIVVAVDTSGSISTDQLKVFINQAYHLSVSFDPDRVIILYVSDSVDDFDDLDPKLKQQPDFRKVKSTYGNNGGFTHPFRWLRERNIIPSVFVYCTDTQADMPNPSLNNIPAYRNKCFWLVCSRLVYNYPPFGRVLHIPIDAIQSKIKK